MTKNLDQKTQLEKEISMNDLYHRVSKLEKKDLILDVRTPEEYQEGHVAGSYNISHDQIQNHINELKQYQTIYVHCRSGKRAQTACNVLEQNGLKNTVLIKDSGMQDWMKAGYPIETGPARK